MDGGLEHGTSEKEEFHSTSVDGPGFEVDPMDLSRTATCTYSWRRKGRETLHGAREEICPLEAKGLGKSYTIVEASGSQSKKESVHQGCEAIQVGSDMSGKRCQIAKERYNIKS